MIPSPIVRVLSTIQKHGVKALLMGGQACVFYGAVEFSRDADIAILAERDNLKKFRAALDELKAGNIAVPEFKDEFLHKGHAVHFRCQADEVAGVRIDVMSQMRGVDPFPELWERRTTLVDDAGNEYHLLSLNDLVQAKKTQRDKDWPMISRLLEANYYANKARPTNEHARFWLLEMRTPELLISIAKNFSNLPQELLPHRPLLAHAISGDSARLEQSLFEEQRLERQRDREYWEPLKKELESLRMQRHRQT